MSAPVVAGGRWPARARRVGLLAGVLLAVQALLPIAAPAHLYWTNDGGSLPKFVNLDGTGGTTAFSGVGGGTKAGLAVAGGSVYFVNRATGAVGRANLDGSGAVPSLFGGTSGPQGIAADGTYIYWANSSANTIGRANLDGSSPNQSFITGAGAPAGVAVDGAHVYWANSSGTTIGRANLDGSSVNQSFVTGASAPFGVAVDGTHVYWANSTAGSIGRANLDGSSANQSFITGAGMPMHLAVDARHVYWADYTGPGVGRANLDGSGAQPTFVTGTGADVVGVAVAPQALMTPTPGALSFGTPTPDPQGTTSAAQQVTFENTGTAPLVFTSLSLGGANPDDFAAALGTCAAPVAPGASCAADVRFAPREQGARSATLIALTNAPAAAATQLSGTAGPPPSAPEPLPLAPPAPAAPLPSSSPAPVAVSFASLVTLPSTKRCVSRRRFRIRLRAPAGARPSSAEVRVNGRRVRTVKGAGALTAPVDLRNLPKGSFRVEIRIRLADGRTIKGTRRYRTCAARKR